MGHPAKQYREDKAAHERRIFLAFCAASGLASDSITQPDPPDIIAELNGCGRVAFELVRLNHEDELLSSNLLRELVHALIPEQFAKVPEPQRSRLSAMYADAHVLIEFSATANPAERKLALPFVWALLASRPAGAKGELYRAYKWQVTCAPSHLVLVYAARTPGETGGPHFYSQSLIGGYPVQTARLIQKLQKPYSADEPLELLAYAERGEFSFESDIPELTEAVRLHLPGSAFRRVWGYEELHGRATLLGER